MDKLFRSMGIIAVLGNLPIATHALEVVEWTGPAASPGMDLTGPATSRAGPAEELKTALQHGNGTVEWARLGAPWGQPLGSASAPAPRSSASTLPPPDLQDPSEHDRGSPLLAGLGAMALLMWRRLRHH